MPGVDPDRGRHLARRVSCAGDAGARLRSSLCGGKAFQVKTNEKTLLELLELGFEHAAESHTEARREGRRRAALSAISLELRAGSFHFLLGANGAGKSTLLQVLNGTHRPTKGRLKWKGELLGWGGSTERFLRSRVALLFHESEDQIFGASPLEDVALGLLLKGLERGAAMREAGAMLERLGLSELAHEPVYRLSHGQKRRVALAALLVLRPEVLALDEPTSGLDPRASLELLLVLQGFVNEGMAVLLSTHDLGLAREWADQVTLLREGRVLASGAAKDIFWSATLLTEAGLLCSHVRRKGRPALANPVMIVGAGPGDPELLTRKAAALLSEAEIVLKDVLVPDALLTSCHFRGEIVDVGRRCGAAESQELRQERIHQLLKLHYLAGKRVVRLKSGDPMMFGRAMEEARYLASEGIPFELVPGVSAGIAAANLGLVPLTERRKAPSVLFCSGHTVEGPQDEVGAWARLLCEGSSVVLYMGLRSLERVVPALLREVGGVEIWVTAMAQVSQPGQGQLCAPLAEIVETVTAASLPTPVVFILGRHAVPLSEESRLVPCEEYHT